MAATTRRTFVSLAATAAMTSAFPNELRSRFRLAVTTDEIDNDLLTAIEFLRRFGLEYAEIRNVWGKYNTSQPVEKIHEARRLLDSHGIKTAIVDTGFFKIPVPAENADGQKVIDKQWKLLDRAMERAKILGTDRIRTFAFTYPRGGRPDEANYPRIIELVKESARRAKARGFRLALENVGHSYVATAADSARMLKAISIDSFGLTWDPNNAAQMGGSPFPKGYAMLDPARIFHVHLRDYRYLPSGKTEWCGVGQGEFDHLGQLRALVKAGYQETFSLETHYTVDGSKAKASEASLTALLKLMERV
jgi:L-ribulose-5-phosphate 3-epimerase